MSLKCGIIGVANIGKTTLFNCMSSTKAEASRVAFASNKTNRSVINVPDARLAVIEKYQPTDRTVHATVEISDIPGLTKSSGKGDGSGNKFLASLQNQEAIKKQKNALRFFWF